MEATHACADTEAACTPGRQRALPTGEEECDETGFFGHVQLEAGTAEDIFDHSF